MDKDELTPAEKTAIMYSQFSLFEWKLINFALQYIRNGIKEPGKQVYSDILNKLPSQSFKDT